MCYLLCVEREKQHGMRDSNLIYMSKVQGQVFSVLIYENAFYKASVTFLKMACHATLCDCIVSGEMQLEDSNEVSYFKTQQGAKDN